MFPNFKETLTSLQDKTYGKQIISRNFSSVWWYWSKYFLWLWLIYFIIAAYSSVYFLPRLPKVIKDNFPAGNITLADGQITSTFDQPLHLGSNHSIFILDEKGSSDTLNTYDTGIAITKDQIYFKDDKGDITSIPVSDINYNLSLSKDSVADFINQYQSAILAGIGLIFVFLLGTNYLGQSLSLLFSGGTLWILSRIFRRKIPQLSYSASVQILTYASILPLIISGILWVFPNNFISLLNLFLVVYFVVTWVSNLPKSSHSKRA